MVSPVPISMLQKSNWVGTDPIFQIFKSTHTLRLPAWERFQLFNRLLITAQTLQIIWGSFNYLKSHRLMQFNCVAVCTQPSHHYSHTVTFQAVTPILFCSFCAGNSILADEIRPADNFFQSHFPNPVTSDIEFEINTLETDRILKIGSLVRNSHCKSS